jgi:hypothetical protein
VVNNPPLIELYRATPWPQEVKRKLTAILSADVKGYKGKTTAIGKFIAPGTIQSCSRYVGTFELPK